MKKFHLNTKKMKVVHSGAKINAGDDPEEEHGGDNRDGAGTRQRIPERQGETAPRL